MKYALYFLSAIINFVALICLAMTKYHPELIYVFMICLYVAYKLIAYTNKKYSKKPATW